jgi:dCMP deaminase
MASSTDRPTLDQYLMALAKVAASRTTCIRRGVGCVLADSAGRVLAIGYNGVASKMPHCNAATHPQTYKAVAGEAQPRVYNSPLYGHVCLGYGLPPGQDSCEAVHAEQNALVQCSDPDRVAVAYVTLSPCKACAKLLLGTGCRRIVFVEEHVDPFSRELWEKTGRAWQKLGG